MKIGIDITPLAQSKKAGIAWYSYNLLKNLSKIDTENFYILYAVSIKKYKEMKKIKEEFKQENFKVSIKFFSSKIYNYTVQTFIPIEFYHGKFDIIHTLHPFSPVNILGKQVITIHDITPLINPDWFLPFHYEEFKFFILRAVKRADKIIADSFSTKNDLINYFKLNSEKIDVVYLAPSEIYKKLEDKEKIEDVKKKYGITKKYLLFVGTIEPRKNIIRLIDAFILIKNKIPELQLVICGQIGWKSKIFYKKMAEIPEKITKDIILTGYVPIYEMPYLYNGCEVFVYPSLYEGFGLPVIEAMACGVPVITSNISSLPEVAGNAGILVNPYNIEEIVYAIEKILTNVELRNELINKGLERAKLFSWEKTAKETLEIYKRLKKEVV